MLSTSINNTPVQGDANSTAEDFKTQWYVVSTNARHEKHVAKHLDMRNMEHFLPLYESRRRWKDRFVSLEMPLFPGYVFVHLALRDRLKVLQVPGVVRLVGFSGNPTPLPEDEIKALRNGLNSGVRAEPHPYLTVGRKVRVKGGPLEGLEGILLKRKNQSRLVISMQLILRSVVAEVEERNLEPV